MKTFTIGVATLTACCVALGSTTSLAQSDPQAPKPPLPAGHPQVPPPSQPQLPAGHPTPGQPQLPAGHPTPGQPQLPAGHPVPEKRPATDKQPDPGTPPPGAVVRPEADPADVASVEAVIKAYYASVSGAKGETRNWDRLRSLMCPEMMMFSTREAEGGPLTVAITVDTFIEANRKYFERGGYYEREIYQKVETFGHVAHVLSTYEARRNVTDAAPYSRGLNSFQLLNNGARWFIVSMTWQTETPTLALPTEFTGTAAAPAAPAAQPK